MKATCLAAVTVMWIMLGDPVGVLCAQRAGADFAALNKIAAQGSLSADETKDFMKVLAQYVFDNHLRRGAHAPMRGMVYEYLDVARKGQPDQFVQGEGLDTMHDGAWLAAALVGAQRATGDSFYKDFLTRWLLPFYCHMLNHSDQLFSPAKNDARAKAPTFDREHQLQAGEKGFVPYWWDDGGSISLERRRDKNPRGPFACTDLPSGQPKFSYTLAGYSHGSSNHLAQDLGVMLQQAWLLLRESRDADDRKLAATIAQAARHLHECRMRHHGHIPMCAAPAALAGNDAALMRHVPDLSLPAGWNPSNHYTSAFYDYKPDKRQAFPGFADDQQYRYYFGIAKHGGTLPRPLAFRTVYDAFTEPLLFRAYCDDATPPPGINRFDLHPYYALNGRPADYRSDRKGPNGKPRPIGARMGPQNMACAGWSLQILKAFPGIWNERPQKYFAQDIRVHIHDPIPGKQTPIQRTSVMFGDTAIEVYCRRESMVVAFRGAIDDGALTIHARPDAKGEGAIIRYRGSRDVKVTSTNGAPLMHRRFDVAGGGFRVFLPFTADPRQKPWANGVEHGRLSLESGGKIVNIYLASSEQQVVDWLEYDLGCGLRVWREIFHARGYIPTGIGAGDWDRYSDTGGYAHLIAAGSQWLMFLDGRRDWEVHQVPALTKGAKP